MASVGVWGCGWAFICAKSDVFQSRNLDVNYRNVYNWMQEYKEYGLDGAGAGGIRYQLTRSSGRSWTFCGLYCNLLIKLFTSLLCISCLAATSKGFVCIFSSAKWTR